MTDLVKVTVDTQDLEVSLNYANERNSAQDDLLAQVQASIAALEDELHGVVPTPNVDVALAALNTALVDLTAVVSTNTDSLLAVEDRVAALEGAPPVDLSGITSHLTALDTQISQVQATVAALPPPTPGYDDTDLKNRLKALEGILAALVPYDDTTLKNRLTADENTLQSLTTVTSRVSNIELHLVSDEARITKLEAGSAPTPPTPPASTDPFISPFSVTSPWNTKIVSLGAKRSDNWGTSPWPSRAAVPVFVANGTGTTWTVVCPQATVTGKFVGTLAPGTDGDKALCLVIGDDVWSFWLATPDGTNHFSASLGIKCSLSGTGVGPAPGVKAGTRASGFPILGGLITGQNLTNKVIPHVLAGAIPRACLLGTAPGYVSPAVTADSGWQTSYTGTVANGSHWGIPKTVACPSTNVDCQTVWTALQTYGLFIGDADSTGLAIYLERTTTTDAQASSIGSIMAAIVANLCPVTA